LQGAYLQGADLRGADLQGAYLQGAYLEGAKIKNAIIFTGLYAYIVIPYITEDNIKRLQLGCYDRTLTEWEENFSNNDLEFPNDGSTKSELRMMAFKTAKMWFDIIDKEDSNEKKTTMSSITAEESITHINK